MTEWEGFEIVCVERDEDAEFDDCRSIDTIGVLAPSLKRHDHDVAWASLQKRPYWYHVDVNGEAVHPEPDTDGDRKFIRITDGRTEDDPLLQLPDCDEYELQHQFESL